MQIKPGHVNLVLIIFSFFLANCATEPVNKERVQLEYRKKAYSLNPKYSMDSDSQMKTIGIEQQLQEKDGGRGHARFAFHRFFRREPITDLSAKIVLRELSIQTCSEGSHRSLGRFFMGGFFAGSNDKSLLFGGVGIAKFAHEDKPFAFAVAFSEDENFVVLDEHRDPKMDPINMVFFHRLQNVELNQTYDVSLKHFPNQRKVEYSFAGQKTALIYDDKWIPYQDGNHPEFYQKFARGPRSNIGVALFNPYCPKTGGTNKVKVSILKTNLFDEPVETGLQE